MPDLKAKNKTLVVGLGEILWDIFPGGKRLGGAPANFAYHAAKQGCVGLVLSAVGDDELGREIEMLLRKNKLQAHLVRRPNPTGTVNVMPDDKGIASYVFAENCAWDALPFSPETEAIAKRVSAVCFGTLAQRNPYSRSTILRFLDSVPASALRIFDINLRENFYSREIVVTSLERCTILKLNEDEAPIVARLSGLPENVSREAFVAELFGKFPDLKIVVQTLGAAGSVIFERTGTSSFVPADESVRVVDTVGAGDAFTAGFVASLLAGKTLREAHLRAAKLAAYVCSISGAGMPD